MAVIDLLCADFMSGGLFEYNKDSSEETGLGLKKGDRIRYDTTDHNVGIVEIVEVYEDGFGFESDKKTFRAILQDADSQNHQPLNKLFFIALYKIE